MAKRSRIRSITWAAYVLGHDVERLSQWHQSVWGCRTLARDGLARFADPTSQLTADLRAAIERFVNDTHTAQQRVLLMGQWLAEWVASVERLLREMSPARAADWDIDWELDTPPGLKCLLMIGDEVAVSLGRRRHLERWRVLGQMLHRLNWRNWSVVDDGASALCKELGVIDLEGRYPFVSPLVQFLADELAGRRPGAGAEQFVDPITNVPTFAKVDAYIRRELALGIEPEPLIELTVTGVRFAGTMLQREDFHPAEWSVLVSLCRKPRTLVSSVSLSRACGLRDGATSLLPPHVSRLRRRLMPALRRRLAGKAPEGDERHCYIVARRFPSAPASYSLEVDDALVRVAQGV